MKTIVLIVMVVTVGMLHGISYTASFQLSNVSFSSDSRGYEVVDYNDLLKTNLRGAPELPVQYLHFIIPIGMSVGSIQITTSQTQLPGTHNVMPSPGFDSILNPPDAAEPDSSIYSLNNLYPNQCVQILRHEYFAGANRIAVVAVYPIQYIPQSGIIVFNQNISFSLNLVNGEQPAAVPISRIARDHDLTLRALQALVSNTGDISTYMYQPNINIIPETTDIEEVIIGPAQYESDFTDFIKWKSLKGVKTVYKTTESIYDEYPQGDNWHPHPITDLAGRIRAYLKDMYTNHCLSYLRNNCWRWYRCRPIT